MANLGHFVGNFWVFTTSERYTVSLNFATVNTAISLMTGFYKISLKNRLSNSSVFSM